MHATGTAANLTITSALLNFGTQDPTVTIYADGDYRITAVVQLECNAATVAAETATLKIRRTSGTPADEVSTTIDLPTATTATYTYGTVILPPYVGTYYAGDVLQVWGSVSAGLGAGTIDASACTLLCERVK